MMVIVFQSAQSLLLPLSGGGGDTNTPSGAGGGRSNSGEEPGGVVVWGEEGLSGMCQLPRLYLTRVLAWPMYAEKLCNSSAWARAVLT